MPVHLYGQMAPMAALDALASEHGLVLVEDAAQSQGARQGECAAGSIGAACDACSRRPQRRPPPRADGRPADRPSAQLRSSAQSATGLIGSAPVRMVIAAGLQHPHVVGLYDYWRDPDGACRLVDHYSLDDEAAGPALERTWSIESGDDAGAPDVGGRWMTMKPPPPMPHE